MLAPPTNTLTKFDGIRPLVDDTTLYRILVIALKYLTFTVPDITYVVQQVCLYIHNHIEPTSHLLNRLFGTYQVLWITDYRYMYLLNMVLSHIQMLTEQIVRPLVIPPLNVVYSFI